MKRGTGIEPSTIVSIEEVTVAGNNRTQLSFFDAELTNVTTKNQTLPQLCTKLSQSTQKLASMNMFDAVDSNLHIISHNAEDGYKAKLKMNVKEKGIPFLKMSSYVKSGIGSQVGFELQGALRSPFGYGEMLKMSSITTQTGGKEYHATLSIPHVSRQLANVNIIAKSAGESQSYFTSFQQHVDSLAIEVSSRDGNHQFTAEYASRDEQPMVPVYPVAPAPTTGMSTSRSPISANLLRKIPSSSNVESADSADRYGLPTFSTADLSRRGASAATTHTAASSVKTSFKYLCTLLDSRDSASNPSQGSFLQGSMEVALPPGTAQFVRGECTAQHHQTLGPPLMGQPGLTASICGSVGIVRPIFQWGIQGKHPSSAVRRFHGSTFLSDRYQLGGPNSLRGFAYCGTGARASRPALVGEAPIGIADNVLANGGSYIGTDTSASGTGVISSKAGAGSGGIDRDTVSTVTSKRSTAPYADPSTLTDSLGGDARANLLATLSVPVPIPILAKSHVRAFLFANAGAISNEQNRAVGVNKAIVVARGTGSRLPSFHRHSRVSIGAGFSAAIADSVRLECTYSIPVVKAPHDHIKNFQLGIGLTIN